jgi:hypothetical protein
MDINRSLDFEIPACRQTREVEKNFYVVDLRIVISMVLYDANI